MISIEELFERRKYDPNYNTSYPLKPEDWSRWKVDSSLRFNEYSDMSFYIHIPFCRRLCKFCEYTRCVVPSNELQLKYIRTVKSDIMKFLNSHKDITLHGFDIGGGTPTSLCDDAFKELMELYEEVIGKVTISGNFIPSIEATFETVTESKINLIPSSLRRISLGVQSTSESLMEKYNRKNSDSEIMKYTIDKLKNRGFIVNLDFMYGLYVKSSNIGSKISAYGDLITIEYLDPDQVTLYEFRPNLVNEKKTINKDILYDVYNIYYDHLIRDLKYYSEYGRNTFSKSESDWGLSSYLKNRMVYRTPYKGFGISAQSMNEVGLSYNIGKGSIQLKNLISELDTYENGGDTYLLPERELLKKFIAISAYSGGFYTGIAKKILGKSFIETYLRELHFLLENKLMNIHYDMGEFPRLQVTREGFKYYGAIFSLFYDR